MRFVGLLLAHAIVVVVATRGDESTTKHEMRMGTSTSGALAWAALPTSACSDSLHGTTAPDRSPAPAPAPAPAPETPSSSSWREARETARRRRITTSPNPHHLPPLSRRLLRSGGLLALLRGGSIAAATGRDKLRESEEHQRVRNVLLFYPNLIGYARIVLVLTSYYLAETNWKTSMGFYLVAFAGDAVDGHVARAFNQASRFGAVLDMVTDRCSTAGLLLVLSRLYGRLHAFGFLVLMFVDLFSHWMHTHSVVDKHHKSTSTLRRRNILIRTYYDHLPFFAFCCIGTELFYVLLYLLHFVSEESRAFPLLHKLCFWLCLPACILKQFINIAQIFSAARTLALEELDQKC